MAGETPEWDQHRDRILFLIQKEKKRHLPIIFAMFMLVSLMQLSKHITRTSLKPHSSRMKTK